VFSVLRPICYQSRLLYWLPPESGGHQTPRRRWSPSEYAIRNTIRYADGSFPLRHHPPCGWQPRVATTHYATRHHPHCGWQQRMATTGWPAFRFGRIGKPQAFRVLHAACREAYATSWFWVGYVRLTSIIHNCGPTWCIVAKLFGQVPLPIYTRSTRKSAPVQNVQGGAIKLFFGASRRICSAPSFRKI